MELFEHVCAYLDLADLKERSFFGLQYASLPGDMGYDKLVRKTHHSSAKKH